MPAQEEARTLPHERDPERFAAALRRSYDTPLALVGVSAGAEAANVRVLTLTVKDRLLKDWPRNAWRVRIRLTATETGVVTKADAVTFGTGTVKQTITINGEWEVETDANGVIVMSVTKAGAATFYIHADVLGKDRASIAFAWAA